MPHPVPCGPIREDILSVSEHAITAIEIVPIHRLKERVVVIAVYHASEHPADAEAALIYVSKGRRKGHRADERVAEGVRR
jgi:hypothetical protein